MFEVLRHSLGFVFHGFTFYPKLHEERIIELQVLQAGHSCDK